MIPTGDRLVSRRSESLPYPSLSPPIIRAVHDALTAAWANVHARGNVIVAERVLNRRMVEALDALQQRAQALDRSVFGDVHRGPEYEDYLGTKKLENRPDIVIGLASAPAGAIGRRHHAVFVECKRIDRRRRKPFALYRAKGITRFEEGLYGWKMRDAFMFAYVFDDTDAQAELPGAEYTPDGLLTSVHARPWAYSGPSAGTPGPIRLWHVWVAALAPIEDLASVLLRTTVPVMVKGRRFRFVRGSNLLAG